MKKSLPNSLPNCTETEISEAENVNAEVALIDSAHAGYIRFSAFSAGVAKLAYAADSKSKVCILCPLLNSSELFELEQDKRHDALSSFAGILDHFEAF